MSKETTARRASESRKSAIPLWVIPFIVSIIASVLASAIYEWLKQPGSVAKVLAFAFLFAALVFLLLASRTLARRIRRVAAIRDSQIQTVEDIVAHGDKLKSPRTRDHVAAMRQASRMLTISIVVFAVVLVVFISVAPWLFGV